MEEYRRTPHSPSTCKLFKEPKEEKKEEIEEHDFNESECKTCGGYYTTHDACDGMTREEIWYEAYKDAWRKDQRFR